MLEEDSINDGGDNTVTDGGKQGDCCPRLDLIVLDLVWYGGALDEACDIATWLDLTPQVVTRGWRNARFTRAEEVERSAEEPSVQRKAVVVVVVVVDGS